MESNNSKNHIGLFLLGLMLSLGFILSSLFVTNTIKSVKLTDQKITVVGFAEKNITSDLGVWTGLVSYVSANRQEAYNKLQKDISIVINFLHSKGVKDENIKIGAISTITNYTLGANGYRTNTIESYSLEQNIIVTLNDVKLIEDIANSSTSLIKDGVAISSWAPQYFYTKINDKKIEMLGEATKDAYTRAEQLAKNSNSEVGSLQSAKQGVFQITPVNSTTVSDYGENDVTSIEKTIKAIVTMEFLIK